LIRLRNSAADCTRLAVGKPLAGVLVLATLLRAGVVIWNYDNLSTDTDSYLAIAENLLAGEGFCSVAGHPTAFRPPLYPLLVAVCLFCGGTFALALVQIALGTATCGLTAVYAARLGFSERTQILAAGVISLDPLLLIYTSHAMTETLVTFLVTLLLVIAVGQGSKQQSVLSGSLFGMIVLCRPSLWAFGGLAGGLFLYRSLNSAADGRRRGWQIALFPAGLLIVVCPWAVRNQVVLGRPVVMTTHGGYTLLLANNPVFYAEVVQGGQVWSSSSLNEWQTEVELSLQMQGLEVGDELGRDAAMRRLAFDNIQKSPVHFVQACLLRLQRFWGPGPATGSGQALIRFGVCCWYLSVFCLFVVGIVKNRGNLQHAWLGLLLVVSLSCVHAVFWSNVRMRAPVSCVLGTLAASAVCDGRGRKDVTEASNAGNP